METKKRENIFRKLARWFVRGFMGDKYEQKWFGSNQTAGSATNDSEEIVSPARQIFNRFCERKIAIFAVFVVVFMLLVVFIGPYCMPKYYDSFTETTQMDLPPTMSFMSVPGEMQSDGIRTIDSYGSFTVGVSNTGKLHIWGVTKLGAKGIDVSNIPQEVLDKKIAFAAAGQDHIIAIAEDGSFYGWGSNRFGQFARDNAVLSNPNLVPVPEIVANGELDVNHIKKVTCGFQASAILMDDGTLYIWGNKQAYSNLERFAATYDEATGEYDYMTGIVDIDFTLNFVCAINQNQNSVFTGVKNMYSAVRTSLTNTKTIKMSEFLNGRKIEEIRATAKNLCLLLDDGTLGFTGDFETDIVDVPQLEADEDFVDIQAGTYHYTGVTNKGNVYSFGGDHYYQTAVPAKVKNASKVYAGSLQSYAADENGKLIDAWGLKGYIFGTDSRGADIFQRVIAGGKITMTVGIVAVVIQIVLGVLLGLLAGYFGGWVDMLIMRISEVFGSIPFYPFVMILSAMSVRWNMTVDERLYFIMAVIGVLRWPGFCNLTRAQILVARESEYVTAAQSMGVKDLRIAYKHILPNIISVILVNMTLSFAASLQTETSLSFLGFGVMEPQPSWGNMLTRASNATAAINFWWQWVFTGAILLLTAVCINTVGDTLRDVMDPKSSNDK